MGGRIEKTICNAGNGAFIAALAAPLSHSALALSTGYGACVFAIAGALPCFLTDKQIQALESNRWRVLATMAAICTLAYGIICLFGATLTIWQTARLTLIAVALGAFLEQALGSCLVTDMISRPVRYTGGICHSPRG